jgi:hypothetical protein
MIVFYRALALLLLCSLPLWPAGGHAQAAPRPAPPRPASASGAPAPATYARPSPKPAPAIYAPMAAKPPPSAPVAAKPAPATSAPIAAATKPPPAPVAVKPAPAPAPATTHDSALLSPPPAPLSTTRGNDPSMREMANPADQNKAKRDPMGWLGISFKLGVASVAVGKLPNPVYNQSIYDVTTNFTKQMLEQFKLIGPCTLIDKYCYTSGRTGFHLAATLHVGGDGFGWDVEPYMRAGGHAVSVGVYTGPKFDIHVANPVYIGFGLGGRVGYVVAQSWRHGIEVFGRIPVHATYYVTPDFALTLEGSFGAGVSGFIAESEKILDPRPGRMGQTIATAPKIAFGAARSWDITFGVRFP